MNGFDNQLSLMALNGLQGLPWIVPPFYTQAFFSGEVTLIGAFRGKVP